MSEISEPVQVQAIIVFGSIMTAVVTTVGIIIVAQLNRTRQHAKAAQYQVQNSHDVNLRDDLDIKFEDVIGRLNSVMLDIGGMRSDIRTIRVEALTDRQQAASDRQQAVQDREHIRELEQTLTPRQIERLRSNKEKL